MFDFDLSDELKLLIRKLSKKDKIRILILNKKIKQIINNDIKSIDRYKNCRYDLKEYKRIHVDRNFVLLFKINKEKKIIYLWKLIHHDKAYK